MRVAAGCWRCRWSGARRRTTTTARSRQSAGARRGAERRPDAMPVVVDTDLGGDDLVALAFLLRHPDVRGRGDHDRGHRPGGVRRRRRPGRRPAHCAGRSRCRSRADGRRRPGALQFPAEWRDARRARVRASRRRRPLAAAAEPAAELIGALARREDALAVVALGPMTNLADLAASSPGPTPGWPAYTRWVARSTGRWSTAWLSGTPPLTLPRSPRCSKPRCR